ncbi:hypothetical protein QTP88_022962 [Uroleucon formosanum]
MEEHSNILEELVRAKENIKRKYTTVKTVEANVQQLMAQTFKPIIDPLTKISNTRDLYNNQTRKEDVKIDSEINNTNEGNNYDNYQLEIENWFQSKDIDKTFDPKKIANDDIILGDKEVKFAQDVIIIDETTYPATSVSLKNNISTLQERIKSLEDSIRQNNKSLLDSESRISQLFDNYSKATTLIGITREDVIRVNDTITNITQELEENSLSDHGLFIA